MQTQPVTKSKTEKKATHSISKVEIEKRILRTIQNLRQPTDHRIDHVEVNTKKKVVKVRIRSYDGTLTYCCVVQKPMGIRVKVYAIDPKSLERVFTDETVFDKDSALELLDDCMDHVEPF